MSRAKQIAAMLATPRWSVREIVAAPPSGPVPPIEALARIAALAGLPAPQPSMAKDLHRQLGFLETLSQVDTDGVEPLARMVPVEECPDLESLEADPEPEKWMPTTLAAESVGPFYVVKREQRTAA